MSQPPPGPGWYQDPAGAARWWDGGAWGPPARAEQENRSWAVVSHVSFFVLPLVAAVVLRVTVGRQGRFVRHHTNEALNAQLWMAILWNGSIGTVIATSPDAGPPGWGWALLGVAGLAWLGLLVLGVVGAVRASQGRYWRYPLPFRFTRGSVRG